MIRLGPFIGVALMAVLLLPRVAFAQAPPPAPNGFEIMGDDIARKVALAWDAVPGADAYRVEKAVVELNCPAGTDVCMPAVPREADWRLLVEVNASADQQHLRWNDHEATVDRYNCYRVRAVASGLPGEGAMGCTFIAEADPKPPAPRGLTATLDPGFLSVRLEWMPLAEATLGYVIERSLTGSFAAPRDWKSIEGPVLPPGTTSFVDHVGQAGWYCYRVVALARQAASDPSAEACVARPVVDFGPGPFPSIAPGPPDAGSGRAVSTAGRGDNLAPLTIVAAAGFVLLAVAAGRAVR